MIAQLFAPSLITTPGMPLENLFRSATSYEHTISATFGFESATIQRITTLDATMAYTDLLLAPLVVYGPDADVIWEGYLNSVTIDAGGRARSVNLDDLQNRIRVRYQTVLGTPGVTAAVSDAASIARYGTRDGVVSVGTSTAAAATSLATAVLNERDTPRAEPTSSAAFAASAPVSPVQLTLGFVGWYSTFGWVVLERTDTSTEQTSAQIATLIGTAAPGIRATNQFTSAFGGNIAATGVNETRKISPDTTYRAAIERLLSLGNSSNQRLAWGIYENRELYVTQWAGATPNNVTYRLRLGSSRILDSQNLPVAPWRVRPNTILEDTDFADPTPGVGADTASRFFVERVAYRRDKSGESVTFEPAAYTGLDARLARLG